MLKLRKNKFVLGVTGGIGCGKSTVAGMFKDKDCLLIDADRLGHELISSGTRVSEKIIKSFGLRILKPDNSIDRVKLSKKVFANKAALAKFNRIVHPELIRQIKRLIRNSQKKIIILKNLSTKIFFYFFIHTATNRK